jgi:hypothetical protein
VYSSQHIDKAGNGPLTCVASQLITNCIESVVSMAKLKMSPEFVSLFMLSSILIEIKKKKLWED